MIDLAGGIDAVNASRVFPEIRLHDSRYVVYEDSVIYQQAPPSTLELPTILDFDLNILVAGVVTTDVASLTPFAVGTVSLTEPPGKLIMIIFPKNHRPLHTSLFQIHVNSILALIEEYALQLVMRPSSVAATLPIVEMIVKI